MCHVDHAHQPVGDGEAERGQQQDGAERDAREQQSRAFGPRKASLDFLQRALGLGANAVVGVVGEAGEERARLGAVGLAERANGGDARLVVAGADAQRGGDGIEDRLDLGVLLRGERPRHGGQHRGLGAARAFLGGGEARVAIGIGEFQRGDGAVDHLAHAVVDRHLDGLAVHGDRSFGERLQELDRLRVPRGDDLRDDRDLLVVVAGGDALGERGIDRVGGQCQQCAQQQQALHQ